MTTSKDAALLIDASSILIPSLKEFAKNKVDKQFLTPDDKVLIVDDFLATKTEDLSL